MKLHSTIFFMAICLFLFSPFSSTCAEKKNDSIGMLDLLLLQRSVTEKGKTTLEQAIMKHNFTERAPMDCYPPIYRNIPFCITYQVRNDDSVFSKEVFDRIIARSLATNFLSRNYYNKPMYDKNAYDCAHTVKSGTYIDDCTAYRQQGDTTEITARFYDKNILLTVLGQLK
jgi:hypothetical protein